VEIKKVSINDVNLWKDNPRNIKTADFKRLKKQIEELGVYKPLIACPENGGYTILGGNMRLRALKDMGLKEVDISIVKPKSKAEKIKYALSDNDRVGEYMGDELAELVYPHIEEIDLSDYKVDLGEPVDIKNVIEDYAPDLEETRRSLAERFIVPPFSVFDTRQGYWQDRKKDWKRLIGDIGQKRGTATAFQPIKKFKSKREKNRKEGEVANSEVSILDPVLAELCLKWFNINKGKACDPFAGDTVFGFVSGYLGYKFTGIELRREQVDFNQNRCNKYKLPSKYICDDGQNVGKHINPKSQDFLFSCPPYFDLEIYSDLPNDASNQINYEDYIKIIDKAFINSIKCLRDDRFAVIVISDIRDKKGVYRRIPDNIKDIFTKNGMNLYNEIILFNQPVTAALRARKSMLNRKVIRCHQLILVFYKGNIHKIKDNFPELDFSGVENESRDI